MPRSNLSRDEAVRRAALISDVQYEVDIDLSGDQRFRSETTVRFRCSGTAAATHLDCSGSVTSVTVNGREVAQEAPEENRIRLDSLEERNEVRVVAEAAYSHSGKGMNRFVDPVDNRVYVHTDSEPFDAHRTFACFDQPDIKGTFRFTATAPEGWEVISNSRAEADPETADGRSRWRFKPTPPISTYVTVLAAGPFHVVRDRHRNIDLGLYCRQTLAEHLEPDEWLEATRQGLDFFEQAFGYPYVFDKYDQAVVPEFAAGAMENPGCVTFHEEYIFRSRVTDSMRESRFETILHEMAHMWFGDLVTMRWWDDLWLNESFASYAAVLSQVENTRFRHAWTTFANSEKTWALQQDQLPTTHPIVADIPDVLSVHLNFDGITYAKGAAVLKQLVAWVGLERFLEGMKSYFASHEYGNTELKDFLATLEETSGRDLDAWSKEWLETPGVNTLRPEIEIRDGAYTGVRIAQEAPDDWPTLRSHRVGLGLYDDRDGRLVRRRRVELDVVGERSEVGDLVGERLPALTLVNDEDLTFAKVRFDQRSLETVRERLGDLEDPLARAVCWAACWDMTRDAEMAAREYLDLVLRHGRLESQIGALERALTQASLAIDLYGDPAHREAAGQRLAEAAQEQLRQAEPGSDHQLAWARAFVSKARSTDHRATVRGVLKGSVTFDGLAVDTDFRWQLVVALAAAGEEDAEELVRAELDRDPTDKGQRNAASARAAVPTEEAKESAWSSLVEDRALSHAVLDSIMHGFQQPGQDDLLEPYARRYFEILPRVWEERDLEVALDFGERMYPRWIVSDRTVEMTDAYLRREGLPGPIRRLLIEGRDRLLRAQRARRADAVAGRAEA